MEKEYCKGCGAEMKEMPMKGAECFGFVMFLDFKAQDSYDKATGKRIMRRWVKCPNQRWWNGSNKHTLAHAFGAKVLI